MSKPIDYDSPRRPAVEIDDDSLEQLKAHSTAVQSPGVDLDEAEAAETFELPGADLSADELTVTVIPIQSDESPTVNAAVPHRTQQARLHRHPRPHRTRHPRRLTATPSVTAGLSN